MGLIKKIGIIFILLFSLVSVNADLLTNNKAYWTLDNTLVDSTGNGNTLVNTGGATFTGSGKINGAYDFEFDNSDYMVSSTLKDDVDFSSSYSISGWIKLESTGGIYHRVFEAGPSGDEISIHRRGDTGKLRFFVRVSSVIELDINSNSVLSTGTWYFFTVTYDGTNAKMYIDGVLQTETDTGNSPAVSTNTIIGSRQLLDNFFDGVIDEVSVWQESLSQSNINIVYNSSAGAQYPYGIVSGLTFTNITADNITLINNTFYNDSINFETTVLNTSTNANVNHSYTLTSNNSFNITSSQTTITNVTTFVSNDLTSKNAFCLQNTGTNYVSHPINVNSVAIAIWNGSNWIDGTGQGVLGDMLCGGDVQYATNSLTGSFDLNLSSGNYTISFFAKNNETNVSSSTYSFTVDLDVPSINNSIPLEINDYNFNSSWFSCTDINLLSCNISINGFNKASGVNFTLNNNGNLSYNITAIDLAGNTLVESDILFVNPNVFFNFEDTSSGTLTNLTLGGRSDVNGVVTYTTYNDGLVIGSNSLVFEKLGYITQTINFNLNNTAPIFNQTYTVSDAEIIVTILDRETGTIVSGPEFQLEFIAAVGLVTNTTTGTKTITNTLFQAGQYQLVSSADNYTTEQLFFEFTNQESLSLTIYTTDTTDLARGVVEIKVVDKFGKSIVGAIAQALQWDSNTSSYIKVSEGLTAEDGKTLLNIILDTKQYIFHASFESLSKNTTPQFIPELLNGKLITISLDLGPTEFEGFLENVNYNIIENFSNSISNITLDWETTDGTDIEGCIIYYRVQPSGVRTELSNDCSTGSNNILIVSKQLNSSYYIEAHVGFIESGGFYLQQKFLYPPIFDIATILEETNLALFVLPLLYLVVVLIGMANVFIGAVLLLLVNGIGLWLLPQFITTPVVAFFYFVGLALMIGGSKRK